MKEEIRNQVNARILALRGIGLSISIICTRTGMSRQYVSAVINEAKPKKGRPRKDFKA